MEHEELLQKTFPNYENFSHCPAVPVIDAQSLAMKINDGKVKVHQCLNVAGNGFCIIFQSSRANRALKSISSNKINMQRVKCLRMPIEKQN